MKIAVFPGSFDPITLGHESVINRASVMFDKIYVAIGINANKKYLFDLEDRIKFIKKTFESNPKVEVRSYATLTVQLCQELGATSIIRGLRNTDDFNFEFSIAHANRKMDANIETIFLATDPEFLAINSSIVRDIYRHGGDIKAFIPDAIEL